MIQVGRCMMSATEQEAQATRQEPSTYAECSAVADADMDSQLSDPPDSQVTVAMEEGDCNGGGELKPRPEDRETRKATEQLLTEQGKDMKEEEPDASLSSVKSEPEAIQTGHPVDGQRQESSTVTEKQQIQSEAVAEESMASQSSSSSKDEDSGSEQPQPKPTFPTTLMGFGYHFNKDGQLRSLETGEPFVFEVKKGDQKYNQAHYEALGEVITEEVYRLIETEAHLERVYVPLKQNKDEPRSFIFKSVDAMTNPDKLMLLIHGSGVVRAGQWARSLIINDCLESGTQLPYIKQAISESYGVIVFNTNYNQAEPDGPLIRENGSPREHAQYVWKHFVKNAKAKKIYIVAHSFGGVVTVDLMAAKFDEFKNRVHKIAFTDSVHILHTQGVSQKMQKWIIKKAVNWVSSDQPLDHEVDSHPGEVKRVSAGTQRHVETSWFAFKSIFKFFSES